ncbi:BA14K family protein [Phyllobacterium sp. 21LDTY02-6]|uniref:BA14K family protein n=1 Tax=Phyllobacterium sp. 21LDTY02-6 TaxID=2944903 RepID=UPI00201FC744|nr:BA14K family protein [Phyllobacterium sp. 21LDTY02-6]MCO4319660.1 BA14K family protein [Phyllobacterium sp. 21LDTY02-6]
MRKIVSGLFAGVLSLAMGVAAAVPVSAAPLPSVPFEFKQNVEQVQYREHRRWRGGHWRGHRGYRHHRRGYRRHSDGWWYPLAAFGAGAIIGGAIANQPRRVIRSGGGSAHVQWCYDKYRSYRASDNTYQPYNGPRQQCYSPYS